MLIYNKCHYVYDGQHNYKLYRMLEFLLRYSDVVSMPFL